MPGDAARMLELNRRSARVRQAKSRLKSDLKAGRLELAALLEMTSLHPFIADERIATVLSWERGIQRARARQMLLCLRIDPATAVGRLPQPARAQIALRLRDRDARRAVRLDRDERLGRVTRAAA